jgi:hypothetical protein
MIDFRCWNSLVLGKSIADSKVEIIEACKIIKDARIFYYCTLSVTCEFVFWEGLIN